jgi:hypothetical protein
MQFEEKMMEPSLNDIDDMIVHEKMQAALEYHNEAWADGMADGIEPEIIADTAIIHALRETIRLHGEEVPRPCWNRCANACWPASSHRTRTLQ